MALSVQDTLRYPIKAALTTMVIKRVSASYITSEVARSPPEKAPGLSGSSSGGGGDMKSPPHKPRILQHRPGSSFRYSLGNASPDSSPQTPDDHVRVGSLNLQHGMIALRFIRPTRMLPSFGICYMYIYSLCRWPWLAKLHSQTMLSHSKYT
jgi:hypothetical protein